MAIQSGRVTTFISIFDKISNIILIFCYNPTGDSQIPLRHYKGDICNQDDLQKAFDGATIVIHNASIIDVCSSPDLDKIHRINVVGE